jgi:hypothetical protein
MYQFQANSFQMGNITFLCLGVLHWKYVYEMKFPQLKSEKREHIPALLFKWHIKGQGLDSLFSQFPLPFPFNEQGSCFYFIFYKRINRYFLPKPNVSLMIPTPFILLSCQLTYNSPSFPRRKPWNGRKGQYHRFPTDWLDFHFDFHNGLYL